MSMINDVKDTMRKAANSVVDTAENMINKPKTPKELAKRMVEHLSHREYTKIAEILSEEAKKYASHLGIDNFALVETKLNDFQHSMENAAKDMEEGDYSTLSTKINEIESSIPESFAGNTEIPTSIKNLLKDIVGTLENYDQEDEVTGDQHKIPDFSKLEEVFENHFSKMITK